MSEDKRHICGQSVKQWLEGHHTKQLLQLKRSAHRCGGYYDPTETGGCCIDIEEIKEVLATREHIPNKKESKIIRQQAARKKE